MRNRKAKAMWKGISSVIMCAALTLSSPVVHAQEEQPEGQAEVVEEVETASVSTQADEYGFEIEDGVLQKYTGTAAEVVIPEGTTSIGDCAFLGCSSLTGIIIPDSVTSIGEGAFFGCSGLTSITLPSSVTEIWSDAFSKCSSLTSITIPNSVTVIGNNAFQDCSSLTSITIPDSVTSMLFSTFYGCSNLTSIVIPNSITSIFGGVFSGCSSLTSVTIPASVTEIDEEAFEGCDKLTIYGEEGSYAQTYAAENNIPFEIAKDSPAEDPSQPSQPGQPSQPSQPEQSSQAAKYEVTVTAGNTSISSSSMQELVNINQTQDVVIHSTNGVVFTFPKGTMKMVDGKDSYDFGVKITTDYP